jgi:amidase
MPAEVTIRVNVLHETTPRPRIESDKYIMTVYSTSPGVSLSDAVILGHVDLILWLEEEYGFDRWTAWQLCGMVSEVRLGSLYTVAVRFPKKYLRQ